MGMDEKVVLQEKNQKKLTRFKLHALTEQSLKLHRPSMLPGILADTQPVIYTKKRITLDTASTLDVIYHDGRFDSLIFRTTDFNKIDAFKKTGLLPSETLTSRAINALHKYHIKTLDRLYHRNIYSNKHEKKIQILSVATQVITALQPIERLINRTTSKENKEKIIQQCCNEINNIKEINAPLKAQILTALESLKSEQSTKSIPKVIKQQTLAIIREAQRQNQILTYQNGDYAFLRGDLHSYCEDAIKAVHDFGFHPHAIILPEHQGIYKPLSPPSPQEHFCLDLSYIGQDVDQLDSALMQLGFLYDKENIFKSSTPKTVRASKWSTNLNFETECKQILAFTWNLLTGILIGVCIDFPIGFIFSVLQQKPLPSLSEKVKWTPISTHIQNSKYNELKELVYVEQESLGAQLGAYLGRVIRSTFVDIIYGVRTAVHNFSVELYDDLCQDYRSARKQEPLKPEAFAYTLHTLFAEPEKTKAAQESQEDKGYTTILAPPYHIDIPELRDALNALADGNKLFVETFSHNIHAKHSFLGLLFNVSYLFGGLAILAPKIFSFLGSYYTMVSNSIGHAMAHSQLTGSIASGFTQAKLSAGTLEAILHGRDSWLSVALNKFARNPGDLIILSASAVTLGWLIAFKLNIPLLSDTLKEDLGDVPPFALGFAGLKLGVLSFELIIAHGSDKALSANFEERTKQALADLTGNAIHDSSVQEYYTRFLQITTDTQISKSLYIFILERDKDKYLHLPYLERRQWLDRIRAAYPEDMALQHYARHILMPNKTQSILSTTLLLITDYIPLMIRCIASIFTLSPQPWYDLIDKIQTDIARLVQAIATIIHTIASFIGVMIRGIGDIMGNEIFARMEGILCHDSDTSYIAEITYGLSQCADQTYTSICHYLPFTHWARRITTPPTYLINSDSHFHR